MNSRSDTFQVVSRVRYVRNGCAVHLDENLGHGVAPKELGTPVATGLVLPLSKFAQIVGALRDITPHLRLFHTAEQKPS